MTVQCIPVQKGKLVCSTLADNTQKVHLLKPYFSFILTQAEEGEFSTKKCTQKIRKDIFSVNFTTLLATAPTTFSQVAICRLLKAMC